MSYREELRSLRINQTLAVIELPLGTGRAIQKAAEVRGETIEETLLAALMLLADHDARLRIAEDDPNGEAVPAAPWVAP